MIFLAGIVAGLLAGFAAGGTIAALAETTWGWIWLPIAAVGMQLARYIPVVRHLGTGLVLVSLALIALWLVGNARTHRGSLRAALVLTAVGWVLNTAVIAANGGRMPVQAATPARADFDVGKGQLYKHVRAGRYTNLALLEDRFSLGHGVGYVVSAGDIALWLGVIAAIAAAMEPGSRRRMVRAGA